MKIGEIELKTNIILGPMAGVTTLAYREFMKPYGIGLSYSEMISDCGIDYGNHRTMEYLATSKIDRPVGLQLFGSSIEHSVKAVEYLQTHADYDILDLNFGCPVNKVVKTGAGSAWLKDVEGLQRYTEAVVKASKKPVTAKIRLGWDSKSINVFEVVAALEKAGVKAITIHCRTREQGYSGKANYEALVGLKETMSVPLIVSGDIYTPEDAYKALNTTSADGVMIARGGLGNPMLSKNIISYLENGYYEKNVSLKQQAKFALEFADKLIQQKGECIAIHELRGLLPHFFSGIQGSKDIRLKLSSKIESKRALFDFLNSLL